MMKRLKEIHISPLSKTDIIRQYKTFLPLPDYCADNWDSFEECLLDFLEEIRYKIIVIHDAEIGLCSTDRDAYLSILYNAAKLYPSSVEVL